MKKAEDFAKQIKEEEEKKRVQQFKSKLNERVQNKKLPKLARLKDNNQLECVLCKYVCKEEISFTKHYSTPLHKKALDEFQKSYAKKTEKNSNSNHNDKKEERLDVKVGVKRPAEVEYKVEEKYVLVESENKENQAEEKNEPQLNSFKTKDLENTNIIEIEESKNDVPAEDEEQFPMKLLPNLAFKTQEIEKKRQKQNEEDENDVEIQKNLNKMLDADEDNFKDNIMKNLRLFKKQKDEKMLLEKEIHKEEENSEKKKSEENMQIDFNWKKKKLY